MSRATRKKAHLNAKKRERRKARLRDETLLATAEACLADLNASVFVGQLTDVRVAVQIPGGVVRSTEESLGIVTSAVPAAHYDKASATISLHPYLARALAPRYVIHYLLHHTVLPLVLAKHPATNGAGAVLYWQHETSAPQRADALAWLKERAYPAMPLQPPRHLTALLQAEAGSRPGDAR